MLFSLSFYSAKGWSWIIIRTKAIQQVTPKDRLQELYTVSLLWVNSFFFCCIVPDYI
jgi:hypothetical protein